LNLLSHAASRTVAGYIRLKIYPLQDQRFIRCKINSALSARIPGRISQMASLCFNLVLPKMETRIWNYRQLPRNSRLLTVNTAIGPGLVQEAELTSRNTDKIPDRYFGFVYRSSLLSLRLNRPSTALSRLPSWARYTVRTRQRGLAVRPGTSAVQFKTPASFLL
jgi:hypothetical protein